MLLTLFSSILDRKCYQLPAKYRARELYASFLEKRDSVEVPFGLRDNKLPHTFDVGPLYYVTDSWQKLPPVDSRFQVPDNQLFTREQANIVWLLQDCEFMSLA